MQLSLHREQRLGLHTDDWTQALGEIEIKERKGTRSEDKEVALSENGTCRRFVSNTVIIRCCVCDNVIIRLT